MPLDSRAKGARSEREVADFYRARGYAAARTPNSGGLATKGDVVGVPGVHVEAKMVEKLNIWKALAQAEADCPEGQIPTVHFRRSHASWYVALSLEDFADLIDLTRQ